MSLIFLIVINRLWDTILNLSLAFTPNNKTYHVANPMICYLLPIWNKSMKAWTLCHRVATCFLTFFSSLQFVPGGYAELIFKIQVIWSVILFFRAFSLVYAMLKCFTVLILLYIILVCPSMSNFYKALLFHK